ncbi:MAG: exo-alpha-sialidase [Bacteroidales bacterium]|nr:exo-alpha-sialidase [Bacteroidales bacterium]
MFYLLPFTLAMPKPPILNISNGILFDGEPYLVINPTNNQNLVAAWMGFKFSNGQYKIAIKTRASFDGGNSWSIANTLPHFEPVMVRLMFLWLLTRPDYCIFHTSIIKQAPDSGGIYVSRSFDGGLNWNAPTKAFDMYDGKQTTY